ncbi:MAG: phage holin family protein [Cytophagales bacterium]|nr:phage holin family protein [Armatimonadota bacterium]
MRILLRWIVGAVSLYLTVTAAKGLGIEGLGLTNAVSALLAIAVLTLVNAVVRPVLGFLAAPINCLTLGLFSFVLNALMFWLVGALDLGLIVKGFVPALFGSVVLSLISGVLNSFIVESNEKKL